MATNYNGYQVIRRVRPPRKLGRYRGWRRRKGGLHLSGVRAMSHRDVGTVRRWLLGDATLGDLMITAEVVAPTARGNLHLCMQRPDEIVVKPRPLHKP